MFVFFDDCHFSEPQIGDQPDPIPGVHNSGWKQSPGERLVLAFADGSISDEERASLKGFVQGVLRRLGDDKRVLMWNLYNEPGRRQHTPLICTEYMARTNGSTFQAILPWFSSLLKSRR